MGKHVLMVSLPNPCACVSESHESRGIEREIGSLLMSLSPNQLMRERERERPGWEREQLPREREPLLAFPVLCAVFSPLSQCGVLNLGCPALLLPKPRKGVGFVFGMV
ncbi:unnamed protein product [Camellia sinensis]